jgi:dTMP kinase
MRRPADEPSGSGRFITIEGPEGGGKTTQAARLEAHLHDARIPVLRTREPGGTPLGERVRGLLLESGRSELHIDPLADALLFNAARHQLVTDVIRPALDEGTTVVCARYADSTLAYQGHGGGVPVADLRALARLATGGLQPDLTILLDLPPEAGLARKAPDDQTRFEVAFDLAFHRRVRAGFLALAAAEPERFRVVDATRPVDDVWAAVRLAVEDALGLASAGPAAASEPKAAGERMHR